MPNTIDGDLIASGLVKVGAGASANPPALTGGAGSQVTSNRAEGSIHMRTDADTLPEVVHGGSATKMGLAQKAIECRLATIVANQANTYITYMPRKGIVVGVSRRYTSKPASSGGTVVAGITVAGNQILATAGEDEESLTDDVLTAHNLTGTTANLKVAKGDKVIITITSNNADMTGGTGGMYYIYFEDN